MNGFYGLIIAFAMYSRIPVPKVEWTKERMRYLFCFFPLIGAVIGAAMVLWENYGRILTGTGNLHAAILTLIPVLITGGIHADGFLDTMDALSSYQPMEKKLEILKDSHTGAFAVLAGICYFLLLFGAYSQTDARLMPVLAVGFILSRTLSALAVVTFRKAKNTGLVTAFSDGAQKRAVVLTAICYLAVCLAGMAALGGICGILCFLGAILCFFFCRRIFYRKFGGITGDLAGFFVQVCELCMALVAVAAARFL